MRIATWNVNSVRARLDRVLAWLAAQQPDVLCLQELKCTDDAFPFEAIRGAGYRAAVHGQKTYNGVAILSRCEPQDVETGLGDTVDDPQARLIAATVGGVRILSAYVPNGSVVGSEKWAYKLQWLARLREHLDGRCDPAERLVLCGDFNVARFDDEVALPDRWGGSVLCHPEGREALERVRAWGFADVVRQHHPAGGVYSWWDYRAGAFHRGDGLRLDHVFATEPLATVCSSAEVDVEERRGKKPSDHAPVIAAFDVPEA
ncbi:MAG: exodeoxyribonuclease III [Planctomycetota bacterium]